MNVTITVTDLLTFLRADDVEAIQPRLDAIYSSRYTRDDNISVAEERSNNLQNLFRSRVALAFSAVNLPDEEERVKAIATHIATKYAEEFAKVFMQSYSREAREGRISEQGLQRRALVNLVQEIVKQESPISY